MSYVVNNHLNNLYVLCNKAVGPGKKSKIDKLRARVGLVAVPKQNILLQVSLYLLLVLPD